MTNNEYFDKVTTFCDWLRAEGTAYHLRDLAHGKPESWKVINEMLTAAADRIDPMLNKIDHE